jgi:2-polyprenyl-3-methyl-5-hydroxy-6-metoxy-1,4-benzoquinol methylase
MMSDRKHKILNGLNTLGKGLEIGPSYSPVAAKRDGYNVEILDHCTKQDLLAKYGEHFVDHNAIEEVDYVSSGQPYAELIGNRSTYDWIIASHVIEHVPDLIGFLNNCTDILKQEGILSLAIPDKRYCFDRLRPISGLAQIIDCHTENKTRHSKGKLAEYLLNVVRLDRDIAWNPKIAMEQSYERISYVHTTEQVIQEIEKIEKSEEYYDLHAWCFTPSSFRLVIEDLYNLGFIGLRETAFDSGDGFEFYVSLSAEGAGHGIERRKLARQIEVEQAIVAF